MSAGAPSRAVVVLRVGERPDRVADTLRAQGVRARSVVVADVVDRPDVQIREDVGDLARFSWVAVTSANAARRLTTLAGSWPSGTRIAAVGPATALAVQGSGLHCDAIAPDQTASSLASVLDAGPVLFLAAAGARDDLVDALAARHVEVHVVVAYDVVRRRLDMASREELLGADVLVAMSPSALDVVSEQIPLIRGVPVVAIGPTTAAHASATGWSVAASAERRDADAVVAAVALALTR